MSVEDYLEVPTSLMARKAAFLGLYQEKMVPLDVLHEIGIPRTTLNNWLAVDAAFRAEYENVQQDIIDRCDRLLMKHSGLIKWTQQEMQRGLHKWGNIRAIELIKKKNGGFDEKGAIRATVMQLQINGLSQKDLQGMAVAPKSPEIEVTKIETEPIDAKDNPEVKNRIADLMRAASSRPGDA